jgi:outer membrane protein OmpA-like peptidoglycan-associated protein
MFSKVKLGLMVLVASSALAGCAQMKEAQDYGVTKLPKTSSGLPNAYLEWEAVAKTLPVQSELPDSSSIEDVLRRENIGYQVEKGDFLLLRLNEPVQFGTDSFELGRSQKRQLMKISQVLESQKGVEIIIEGHADDEGNALYNEALSLNRATAVADYFYDRGIAKRNLFARGFGDAMPMCSNTSMEGKACNRRAEISIVVHTH